MEELAMDLEALDATREIDARILLVAHRREGEGAIVCADIGLKAPAEGVIAGEEVPQVWRRVTDPRENDVALLTAGLKQTICGGELQGKDWRFMREVERFPAEPGKFWCSSREQENPANHTIRISGRLPGARDRGEASGHFLKRAVAEVVEGIGKNGRSKIR